METRNEDEYIVPQRAIHPGEVLREELKARGIKQKDFATQIGVQATHLNEIIKGKRNMNNTFAIKLEAALDIPFDFWVRMQSSYDYDCKAIAIRKALEQETQPRQHKNYGIGPSIAVSRC